MKIKYTLYLPVIQIYLGISLELYTLPCGSDPQYVEFNYDRYTDEFNEIWTTKFFKSNYNCIHKNFWIQI